MKNVIVVLAVIFAVVFAPAILNTAKAEECKGCKAEKKPTEVHVYDKDAVVKYDTTDADIAAHKADIKAGNAHKLAKTANQKAENADKKADSLAKELSKLQTAFEDEKKFTRAGFAWTKDYVDSGFKSHSEKMDAMKKEFSTSQANQTAYVTQMEKSMRAYNDSIYKVHTSRENDMVDQISQKKNLNPRQIKFNQAKCEANSRFNAEKAKEDSIYRSQPQSFEPKNVPAKAPCNCPGKYSYNFRPSGPIMPGEFNTLTPDQRKLLKYYHEALKDKRA